MDEDERIFLAAAILLAPVGRFQAEDSQIQNAVTNAEKLHAEVKNRHEKKSRAAVMEGIDYEKQHTKNNL